LVYPAAFVGRGRAAGPGGLVTESRGLRLGESWHTPFVGGPVVMSWADVLAGAADDRDGHNVVLHEFAHQLDGESQVMEGIPLLATRADVERWREVLIREMHRAVMIFNAGPRGAEVAGGPGVVNPYGFQSPAEFFACAVEAFYERPAALASVHPGLYELLVGFFGVDPCAWEPCEVGVCVRRGVVA
jgi:MtfA peptidase